MDGRRDHGEPVAIIGVACRFPGARDPAEFHELAVTGRRMFQPAKALPGRPLRAATLNDWTAPPVTEGNWLSGGSAEVQPGLEQAGLEQAGLGHGDLGPIQKLATEMTALALTDAGLREAAGHSRTGMIIASTAPGLGDLVSSQLGFAASGPCPPAARASSLHAVTAAAAALQAGELDLAIAGGAELGLDPVWLTLQARAGTLGTDEMRVYAADPAGLLPGEGCGVVILVRSADARAAGVPVYAEIAGWNAVPADPPELAGPALEQAYQRAGADPADIQYIEGQGTGTAAGDSGRAGRVLAPQAGYTGRRGARCGVREHRLHPGGSGHREPDQAWVPRGQRGLRGRRRPGGPGSPPCTRSAQPTRRCWRGTRACATPRGGPDLTGRAPASWRWPRPLPDCSSRERSPTCGPTWARSGPRRPEVPRPAGPCRGCGQRNRLPGPLRPGWPARPLPPARPLRAPTYTAA